MRPERPPDSHDPLARALAEVAAQRSGENFPVALRILPAAARRHLMAVYGYARLVDDLGDEAPGDRLALLAAVDADLGRLFAGAQPRIPVVAALAGPVRDRGLPPEPLRALLAANRQDQTVTRYPTYADLRAYCVLSANPVGQLVLYLAGAARPDRLVWSDDVCTALQIIEHLQDVGEDYRMGRVYLPQADLAEFGVTEVDLAAPAAPPALRRLVAFEAARAAALLDSGRPLVASLRGWARVAVAGYVAGGRAAVAALARGGHDPLGQPVRPARSRVLLEMVRLLPARPARRPPRPVPGRSA